MERALYNTWKFAYLTQNSLYLGKLSENIHVFDREHFVWGYFSNIVYHLKPQWWQGKKMYCWILGYIKTNLSSCIYVHIIPKCSVSDYFYIYIPLKQPIIFYNGPCIFIQLLLQNISSYSGEITIFPEPFENNLTLLKLSKAKKEHKTEVIEAELSSWKTNQPQAKNETHDTVWQAFGTVSLSYKNMATCFHLWF